jgi:hypothetical protein
MKGYKLFNNLGFIYMVFVNEKDVEFNNFTTTFPKSGRMCMDQT